MAAKILWFLKEEGTRICNEHITLLSRMDLVVKVILCHRHFHCKFGEKRLGVVFTVKGNVWVPIASHSNI